VLGATIFQGINKFFDLINILMLLYIGLSWFRTSASVFRIHALLGRLVEPMFAPFRPIGMYLMQRGFPLDISPLFAFMAVGLARSLVFQIIGWFMF